MFTKKKDVGNAKEHRLSGKDGKKLIEKLVEAFKLENKEVLKEKLGLSHNSPLFVQKFPNRVTAYGLLEGANQNTKTILFFDTNGHGDWYPTLQALWRVPDLLPLLVVHPPVSQFILNGSDVMLPGVTQPSSTLHTSQSPGDFLGDVFKGQKRALVVKGNPQAFAVGEMVVDKATLLHAGMRGKGMRVVHCFRDMLWEINGQTTPNEGFLADRIEALSSSLEGVEGSEQEESQVETCGSADSSHDAAQGKVDEEEVEETHAAESEQPGDDSEVLAGEESSSWTADQLLEKTFLQCVKKKVKDRDLPMLSNVFFSNFLLGCRPKNTTVDVKATSYKKVGKFLAVMEEQGLILMEREKGGIEKIKSIERKHPTITEFKPWPVSLEEDWKDTEKNDGDAATSSGNVMGSVVLHEYYRAQSKASQTVLRIGRELHPSIQGSGPKKEYFTASESKTLFLAFVEKQGLEDTSNRRMLLLNDETLRAALFGSDKKQAQATIPDRMDKAQAVELFQSKLIPGHEFVFADGSKSKFKATVAPRVQITSELRQGRKYVTKAWNLEVYGLEPEQVAKDCQLKFSCACTTQPRPGKEGESVHEIVIQGNVKRELESYFAEQYGLNKTKHISVEESKKKKKSK